MLMIHTSSIYSVGRSQAYWLFFIELCLPDETNILGNLLAGGSFFNVQILYFEAKSNR
jgi:hypothetical protein